MSYIFQPYVNLFRNIWLRKYNSYKNLRVMNFVTGVGKGRRRNGGRIISSCSQGESLPTSMTPWEQWQCVTWRVTWHVVRDPRPPCTRQLAQTLCRSARASTTTTIFPRPRQQQQNSSQQRAWRETQPRSRSANPPTVFLTLQPLRRSHANVSYRTDENSSAGASASYFSMRKSRWMCV